MQNIKIRPAGEMDIERMSCLLSQLFSIETDFVPDDEKQRQGLRQLLATPDARILVAEGQGDIVGMATLQVLVSTAEGGPVGLVEDVVVDRDWRGRGVGSALLHHLTRWAEENRLSRLQLAMDSGNSAASGFYKRNGWNGTDLVMLRRRI